MEENKDYLKEALKLETEKIKIYAVYFAGLITAIGSTLLRESFTKIVGLVLVSSILGTFIVGLMLANSLFKAYNYLDKLKKP